MLLIDAISMSKINKAKFSIDTQKSLIVSIDDNGNRYYQIVDSKNKMEFFPTWEPVN